MSDVLATRALPAAHAGHPAEAGRPAASLRLTDVRYGYAGTRRWVLDGVSLELAAGRVLGIVGPNEAGKSTLCLVAAGLAPAAIAGRLEGEVLLGGVSTATASPHEVAQRAGILFQNPLTQLSATAATVYEEVAFGPRNLGLSVDEIVDRVEAALAALRIEDLASRDPMRLSGGQAQLVALASVVALRPPVLVLDEPTSQLDPAGTRLVGEALAGLAAGTGTAILIVEHKTALLADLADRVALMAAGRIVAIGPAADILADERLVELGVEPPPAVRLRRAAAARGLQLDPAIVDEVAAAHPASHPATQPAANLAALSAAPWSPPSGLPGGGGTATDAARFEGVGFVYPDGTRALSAIDLVLRRGERVGIVGQNGSGKSTLVRQLNGLLRPTEGRVSLFERATAGIHVAELARTVGLAFQNPDRQIFAGSVRAEVAFGARNVGRRGAELDRAVEAALVAVGLEGEAGTNPYDLGYSRRKLLALASILAMETPVIVLDEPTTGQDARGVERIQRIVGELAAAGRTVITISHDMRFVAETVERVIVMRAGRVILDGPPSLVFSGASAELLASTFLEAPLAPRLGERLGLGPTPTTSSLLLALETAATG